MKNDIAYISNAPFCCEGEYPMKSIEITMILAFTALFFVACGQNQTEEESVTFDQTNRAVYGTHFVADCNGRTTYDVDDVIAFSDVVARGTVLGVDAALSPMKSNSNDVPDVDADNCDGTISAGLDAVIRLDRVDYLAVDLGEKEGDTLTLRISAEELGDVWNTEALFRDGALEWTDGQPLMEGDEIVFTAIALEDDLYSLSGHPFAWVSGKRLVSATEEKHSFACLDFEYADELFRGSADESKQLIDRVSSEGVNRDSDVGRRLHNSRLMDAQRGFYPDTARCFVDVDE